MRKILYLALFVFSALCGCNSGNETEWEYKIIPVEGAGGNTYYSRYFPKAQELENSLNQYGKEGWELVSTYTTVETAYPNFGNEQYHTGIKENTRTETLYYVLKRKVSKDRKEDKRSLPSTMNVREALDSDSVISIEVEEVQ